MDGSFGCEPAVFLRASLQKAPGAMQFPQGGTAVQGGHLFKSEFRSVQQSWEQAAWQWLHPSSPLKTTQIQCQLATSQEEIQVSSRSNLLIYVDLPGNMQVFPVHLHHLLKANHMESAKLIRKASCFLVWTGLHLELRWSIWNLSNVCMPAPPRGGEWTPLNS